MNAEEIRNRIPGSEFKFSTSRSSGPGGQNVNKVNTKVELRFNVFDSPSLNEKEKQMISVALKTRINSSGELIITCQSERTQLMNKKKAEEKFWKLLAKVLTVKPVRRTSSPTKASKLKRLENKKRHSNVKRLRNDSGKSVEDI